MPDIISIGECMIELFSEQPMETADTFQRSFAGDSLNILVAASRLGTSTGYVTRVGNDPFTSYLLSSWQAEGIDTSHARRVEGFNAVHFVAQLPGGDREFVYYRKGSAPSTMEPDDLDPEYIGAAKILHVSGIAQAISESARATTLKAAQIARERGVAVSYDPNYRHQLWSHEDAREAMEQTLPYVTYFMPSAPADTDVLFGTSVPEDVISEARSRGVEITAVKLGERGVVVGTSDSIIECPAYTPGRVVDTTGAGDAFNGAFLHGILSGMNVRDAATLGTVTAGLKVRGRGALTTMPTSDEVHDHFRRAKGST
ncbi:MAG: sugar kinase [Chloroflexi bacterium]|nr:sugar kinase [Chloroflexota bacterium]